MDPAVGQVGVIGGGTMGQGIAIDFALAGYPVTVYNTRADTSDRASRRIDQALELLIETGLISAGAAAAARDRIRRTTDLAAAAVDHGYVIETVTEDLALKHRIVADLERAAPPDAILATDTSGLPVDAIFAVCARPERCLATHYFHPAHLVPAVEVAPGRRTDPAVVDRTCAILDACGKLPVVLESAPPGFLGNRLQQALRAEALRLVAAGQATPEQVDRVLAMGVLRKFSIVGIFDRLDISGLEQAAATYQAMGEPVPPFLAERIARGEVGAAAGRGFYDWPPGAAGTLQERVDRHLIHLLRVDRTAGRLRTPGADPAG